MVDSIGRGRSSTRRSSSKPVRFNDDDDDDDDNGDTAIGNTSFFAAIAAKKETKNNSNKKKSPSQDPVSKTSNTAVKTKPKKRGSSRGGHNEDDGDNDEEEEEEEETEIRASPARTSSRRIRITIGNSVVSPPANNAKNYNKRKRDSSKEAKYEVGDVVEVLYEDDDSDEADWYEATILKKKVYHGDIRLVIWYIRYHNILCESCSLSSFLSLIVFIRPSSCAPSRYDVHYTIDDASQSNVSEENIRPPTTSTKSKNKTKNNSKKDSSPPPKKKASTAITSESSEREIEALDKLAIYLESRGGMCFFFIVILCIVFASPPLSSSHYVSLCVIAYYSSRGAKAE